MFKIIGSKPEDYQKRDYRLHRPIRKEEWEHVLRICQAMWVFRIGQCGPHVILPDGRHCDGYINVSRVLRYPWFVNLVCDQLIMEMVMLGDVRGLTRLVVSSGDTSRDLAENIAQMLGVPCRMMHRDSNGDSVWLGPALTSGDTILQVYDLIARLGTDQPCAIDKDRKALSRTHPGIPLAYVPVVGAAVSLAPSIRVDNQGKLAYIMHYQFHSWQPDKCDLCRAKSVALEPSPENWPRLLESDDRPI